MGTELRELVCSEISDFRSWLVLIYLTLGTKLSNFFLPDGAGGLAARVAKDLEGKCGVSRDSRLVVGVSGGVGECVP